MLPISDERILELFGDGTELEIEESHEEEDLEEEPRVLGDLVGEDDNSEVSCAEMEHEPQSKLMKPNSTPSHSTTSLQIGSRGRSYGNASQRMQSRRERSRTTVTRQNLQPHGLGDTWKNIPFIDKPHNYTANLPKNPVRTPSEYGNDYFDEIFMRRLLSVLIYIACVRLAKNSKLKN